jgi:hypothetical protein
MNQQQQKIIYLLSLIILHLTSMPIMGSSVWGKEISHNSQNSSYHKPKTCVVSLFKNPKINHLIKQSISEGLKTLEIDLSLNQAVTYYDEGPQGLKKCFEGGYEDVTIITHSSKGDVGHTNILYEVEGKINIETMETEYEKKFLPSRIWKNFLNGTYAVHPDTRQVTFINCSTRVILETHEVIRKFITKFGLKINEQPHDILFSKILSAQIKETEITNALASPFVLANYWHETFEKEFLDHIAEYAPRLKAHLQNVYFNEKEKNKLTAKIDIINKSLIWNADQKAEALAKITQRLNRRSVSENQKIMEEIEKTILQLIPRSIELTKYLIKKLIEGDYPKLDTKSVQEKVELTFDELKKNFFLNGIPNRVLISILDNPKIMKQVDMKYQEKLVQDVAKMSADEITINSIHQPYLKEITDQEKRDIWVQEYLNHYRSFYETSSVNQKLSTIIINRTKKDFEKKLADGHLQIRTDSLFGLMIALNAQPDSAEKSLYCLINNYSHFQVYASGHGSCVRGRYRAELTSFGHGDKQMNALFKFKQSDFRADGTLSTTSPVTLDLAFRSSIQLNLNNSKKVFANTQSHGMFLGIFENIKLWDLQGENNHVDYSGCYHAKNPQTRLLCFGQTDLALKADLTSASAPPLRTDDMTHLVWRGEELAINQYLQSRGMLEVRKYLETFFTQKSFSKSQISSKEEFLTFLNLEEDPELDTFYQNEDLIKIYIERQLNTFDDRFLGQVMKQDVQKILKKIHAYYAQENLFLDLEKLNSLWKSGLQSALNSQNEKGLSAFLASSRYYRHDMMRFLKNFHQENDVIDFSLVDNEGRNSYHHYMLGTGDPSILFPEGPIKDLLTLPIDASVKDDSGLDISSYPLFYYRNTNIQQILWNQGYRFFKQPLF